MIRRSALALATLGVLAPLIGCRSARPEALQFTLENVGPGRLDSVVVVTTGHRYAIGDLAPGERRSVQVTASGESHFEVEYGHGARHRLNVGGYFESGYVGSYFARVRPDTVLVTRDSVRS
jgi:hypothetical protein